MRFFASVFAVLVVSSVVLACSGNAIIEPAEQTGKRAKAFLAKCDAAAPSDGTQVKMVYACLPAEDSCPEKDDASTKTELNYALHKGSACGPATVVYDVPCGPDLNAVECCYAVRTTETEGGCD